MSAILPVITRPVTQNRSEALLRLPGALYQAVARYFAHRSAIADLHERDESALRDMGLARSQIEAAVHGHIPRTSRGRV